jgi:hypothetical protein
MVDVTMGLTYCWRRMNLGTYSIKDVIRNVESRSKVGDQVW